MPGELPRIIIERIERKIIWIVFSKTDGTNVRTFSEGVLSRFELELERLNDIKLYYE